MCSAARRKNWNNISCRERFIKRERYFDEQAVERQAAKRELPFHVIYVDGGSLFSVLFILENSYRDFHSHRLHRVDGLAYGQIPAET